MGKLFWTGDFSAAPFATPLVSGQVILAQGLSEVHWNARANVIGNVQMDAIDRVHFNGQVSLQGDLAVSVRSLGSFTDGPHAQLEINGNASLQSTNMVVIADEASSSWSIHGNFRGFSRSTLQLGIGGQFDADSIELVGQDVVARDQNGLVIRSIQAPGNVRIEAIGALSDATGTIIDIDGSTRFEAGSILLGNDTSDSIAVDGSLRFNVPGTLRAGVIESHASSGGDAAVTERAIPFSDTFLGSQQTMPTTAIFRRSAEFFIFEKAGASDAAVVRIGDIPIVDNVDGVLSPGRKVSLPMTTEIVVTPSILIEPVRDPLLVQTNYLVNITDVATSVLMDAKLEVFIVKVGFNDADHDGQPSDSDYDLCLQTVDPSIDAEAVLYKTAIQNQFDVVRSEQLLNEISTMESSLHNSQTTPSLANCAFRRIQLLNNIDLPRMKVDSSISSLQIAVASKRCVVGTASGKAYLIDLSQPSSSLTVLDSIDMLSPINAVAISPDATEVMIATQMNETKDSVHFWNLNSKTCAPVIY